MSKKFCPLKNVCLEVKAALFLGPAMLLVSALLSGCWWNRSEDGHQVIDTSKLTTSEQKLDYFQAKRVSRASAAIAAAMMEDDAKNNTVIKGELAIASALLGEPTPDDLTWAIKRANKDDEKYYLAQLDDSRAFIQKLKEADLQYEKDRAKMQADSDAGVAVLKMQLKAKDDEKWTWTAIGLFVAGMAAVYFGGSVKQKAFGGFLIVGSVIAGAIPRVQSEPWFLYAIGGTVGFAVLVGLGVMIWKAKKEVAIEEKNGTPDDASTKPSA